VKSTPDILQKPFFIGIAGTGMSALAQYLALEPWVQNVSGSDRSLDKGESVTIQEVYQSLGIRLFPQDGSGVQEGVTCIVCSTAIEENHPEIDRAKQLGIPRLHRSEVLSLLASTKKSIAIAGTSGKSTVTAMVFSILRQAKLAPSLITGAAIQHFSLDMDKRVLGNAWADKGDWLVFEADESDGTLIEYTPDIGVILNIEKDHKEIEALTPLFHAFIQNTLTGNGETGTIVLTLQDPHVSQLVQELPKDTLKNTHSFHSEGFTLNTYVSPSSSPSHYALKSIIHGDWESTFSINDVPFNIPVPGEHNLTNAIAAITVAVGIGVSLQDCAKGLQNYSGIERRHHKVGDTGSILIVDDFAHNPAKVAACLATIQNMTRVQQKGRVVAIFHPHGYGPLRLLFQEFVKSFLDHLQKKDLLLVPEVYYAGGTVNKNISSKDLCEAIPQARYFSTKQHLQKSLKKLLKPGDVVINMGARDPSLGAFAEGIWKEVQAMDKLHE
jgi:UDP-N-acetylmuramate--alanine ligase